MECFDVVTVNLTGIGKVDMSNFELLKVLGTGGEYRFLSYSRLSQTLHSESFIMEYRHAYIYKVS